MVGTEGLSTTVTRRIRLARAVGEASWHDVRGSRADRRDGSACAGVRSTLDRTLERIRPGGLAPAGTRNLRLGRCGSNEVCGTRAIDLASRHVELPDDGHFRP